MCRAANGVSINGGTQQGGTVTSANADAVSGNDVPLSGRLRAGLVLAGLLAVADIAAVAGPPGDTTAEGPPFGVLVAGAISGVITVVSVGWFWRRRQRSATWVIVVTRGLSLLLAAPALFVADVAGAVRIAVAVAIAATLLTLFLLLSEWRRR